MGQPQRQLDIAAGDQRSQFLKKAERKRSIIQPSVHTVTRLECHTVTLSHYMQRLEQRPAHDAPRRQGGRSSRVIRTA